jgi:monoamine oxidase
MRVHGIEGTVRAHRLDGGLDGLIARLVSELHPGTIRFGETVRRIDWDDRRTAHGASSGHGSGVTGVEVHTDQGVHHGAHVVLACSLVPLRSVQFTPELPVPLSHAIRELGYGTITKTALQFADRTWPAGYATTSLPAQRVYEPTIDQIEPGGEGAVLMAYAGGDGGRQLAVLDEPHRIAAVADDLRSMYGLVDASIGAVSRAWSNEPRYGGSYAAYGPGQITEHWQVLRTPCGPIRLVGEAVATWTGYLEGAVETAERAVSEILASPASVASM